MTTYTPEQLKEIIDLHDKWLRNEPDGQRADLTRADLTDADLYGAILTRADLTDANLTGAYLTHANLTHANLTGANLTHANLTHANLTGANLTRANLTGANLTRAYLTDANLTDIRSFWGTVGNMAEIKSVQLDTWPVTYTATHVQIGCQLHPLNDWWTFGEEQISSMDSKALNWWRAWKPILQTIIAASPAVPTDRAE